MNDQDTMRAAQRGRATAAISGVIATLEDAAAILGIWLFHGWHVAVAYVVSFFVLLAVVGWHPAPKRGDPPVAPPLAQQPASALPR